jgi:hypothetical protein
MMAMPEAKDGRRHRCYSPDQHSQSGDRPGRLTSTSDAVVGAANDKDDHDDDGPADEPEETSEATERKADQDRQPGRRRS